MTRNEKARLRRAALVFLRCFYLAMRTLFHFLGSATLWSGVLLSLCSLRYELTTRFCASFDVAPAWLHVALIASAPLSILGAWLATQWPADAVWTQCVTALHGFALAPMILYVLFLWQLCLMSVIFVGNFILHGVNDSTFVWPALAGLGLPAALMGWCVAGIRLRQWRRKRLTSPEMEDVGLGWPWAAGLTAGVLALVACLAMRPVGASGDKAFTACLLLTQTKTKGGLASAL